MADPAPALELEQGWSFIWRIRPKTILTADLARTILTADPVLAPAVGEVVGVPTADPIKMTLTAELVKAILMAQLVLALAVGEVVEVAMELLAAKMIHMGIRNWAPAPGGGVVAPTGGRAKMISATDLCDQP